VRLLRIFLFLFLLTGCGADFEELPQPEKEEVMASSQGPRSPGTIVNTVLSGIAWSNPSNAAASDDAYASWSVVAAGITVTDYLDATNFGFSIPPNAIIRGILVEVEGNGGGANAINDCRLLKSGSSVGSNLATGSLPGADAYTSFGSATNLWGTNWTPADINSSGFGFRFQGLKPLIGSPANQNVDHVRITVYYDPVGDLGLTF